MTFSEVVGMPELNGGQFRVRNCRPHSFEVDVDSAGFSAYVQGGIVTQVRGAVIGDR